MEDQTERLNKKEEERRVKMTKKKMMMIMKMTKKKKKTNAKFSTLQNGLYLTFQHLKHLGKHPIVGIIYQKSIQGSKFIAF